MKAHRTGAGQDPPPKPLRPGRRQRDRRRPAIGLPALVLFAFVAAFFAWFSAGPIWLSIGHGHAGTAVVADCPVAGLDRPCADFAAADRSFTAHVMLLTPADAHLATGGTVSAQMVSRRGSIAYVGDRGSLYVRWSTGILMILLCGVGIAWSTGTFRLPGRRAKTLCLAGSLGGPILLLIGMLVATW